MLVEQFPPDQVGDLRARSARGRRSNAVGRDTAPGLEPETDFLAALEREPERIERGWAHFWHYAAQGRYGEQLDRLFATFDRERVLLLRYRELVDFPAVATDRVCEFLGVASGVVSEVPRRHVRPDVSARTSWPTDAERAALLPRFAAEIDRVEYWTGWDLDVWRC